MNNQEMILEFLSKVPEATLSKIAEKFGTSYYCNAKFHIGNIMSRLVKSGKVIRIRNGVFCINQNFKRNKDIYEIFEEAEAK